MKIYYFINIFNENLQFIIIDFLFFNLFYITHLRKSPQEKNIFVIIILCSTAIGNVVHSHTNYSADVAEFSKKKKKME